MSATGAKLTEEQKTAGLKFDTAASCKAWVRGLPLTNVVQAQFDLLDQVRLLNHAPVAPAERFRMLELLREPAVFVQTELSKKYFNKPLPLAEVERKSFHAVIVLWQELAAGYQHCVQACLNDDKDFVKNAATACHRALTCVGACMIENLRANHHFAEHYWQELHTLYRHAEQLGVAETPVTDPTSRVTSERTCVGAYVAPILLVLANPNEMFQRQIAMVARWLERWAEKTVILRTAPEATKKPALLVDLASDRGAYRHSPPGAEPRWINIDSLSHTMKKRVHFLRKGQSPAELFLGDDCVQPACEALLVLLYQSWCDGRRDVRAQPRRSVAILAQACSGFDAIHYYLSGKSFKQPDPKSDVASHHRDEIATFGRVGKRDEAMHTLIHGYQIETWNMQNETVAGLRLMRRAGNPGARLLPLQLIAVRPEDSKTFLLAAVRWVVMAAGDDLTIGVRIFVGVPEPVAARSTGINARNDKFQQAFLIPAVPALQSPASAILPPGWFRKDKVLEIFTTRSSKITLVDSLERGYDFERVSFETA
jgi:hypothetical protein